MYLLARRIKSMGFKVVMSGEGADEVFGGYLYFHKAPSAEEFHRCAQGLGSRVKGPGAICMPPTSGASSRWA